MLDSDARTMQLPVTVNANKFIMSTYKFKYIVELKAYQFKNLARFNDGQKIIAEEG